MKNRYFLILLFVFLYPVNSSFSDEVIIESKDINISDNGNRIIASEGVANSIEDGLTIKAGNFDYNKDISILVATKNAKAIMVEKNIIMYADKFIFDKNSSTLNAIGNVEVYDSGNSITIISGQIFYHINQNKIESKLPSEIKDKLGNSLLSKKFIYTLNDGLVKFDNLKFIDIEKNISNIKKAYVNLKSKRLIGKDILIDFNNKNFNNDNEPRLKGNSVASVSGNTTITKGVFTTCKKNDDCPPWQLSAKEITHDKSKKIISYKDAWLKLYDKPVFYFPRFFHPDPSVKRQSGFLMPSLSSSSNIGASTNIPYYLVLSNNKDLTFKPRFYSHEKLLLQSEYRQENSNSSHILDFSFFNGKNVSSRSHLFLNSSSNINLSHFEESELNIILEQVTNDTYLKTYNIQSPIVNNSSLLESSINIGAFKEDLSLDLNLTVFENLDIKKESDRYEYIFPNFNLYKVFKESEQSDGIFSLDTSGYVKKYDTNINERVMINDFYYKSHSKFNENGIKSNYNYLLKNVNTNADNSLKYETSTKYHLASLVEYNSTYPLEKKIGNYNNILKPKISLRYSPNNTKNIRDEERRIDTNNIFNLSRLSKNDTIEGGTSLTYGTQFLKKNLKEKSLIDMSIANIIRTEENKNLPSNSSIGEKMSDVFGSINYIPNDTIKTSYDFALNNNLEDKNYEIFKTEIKINNFVTEFEYLNENNTLGKNSFLSNKTSYNIDTSNTLSFQTRENKKTQLTEFYNLVYQYRNDCLIAAIEYNKDYYLDGDLKPSENIFFKLTIVPFGQTSIPGISK